MERTITMLIADDSPLSQEILSEAARSTKLPLRFTMTDNGRECLTLLNGANIDLAFIDVQMPELTGTQAFWSARKQGIQTFVTLMSSPPAAEAVEMAIKLRAYEFLFKPFTAGDAIGIIKTYARISAPTKILIVDDSSAVRQIVQKVLHGTVFNCEVSEAANGETAAALCRTTDFDVVFLDRNMPGMDGIATMRRLQVIQSSLKIVMMSAEHLRVSAEAVSFGGSRQGAARGLRPAFSQSQAQEQRAAFRRRHRGLDDPRRAQNERPHLRISVVADAALSAQCRGALRDRRRDRARPGRSGGAADGADETASRPSARSLNR